MRLFASDVLSRFADEHRHAWVVGYLKWLEGKQARKQYHALQEELASLQG